MKWNRINVELERQEKNKAGNAKQPKSIDKSLVLHEFFALNFQVLVFSFELNWPLYVYVYFIICLLCLIIEKREVEIIIASLLVPSWTSFKFNYVEVNLNPYLEVWWISFDVSEKSSEGWN